MGRCRGLDGWRFRSREEGKGIDLTALLSGLNLVQSTGTQQANEVVRNSRRYMGDFFITIVYMYYVCIYVFLI